MTKSASLMLIMLPPSTCHCAMYWTFCVPGPCLSRLQEGAALPCGRITAWWCSEQNTCSQSRVAARMAAQQDMTIPSATNCVTLVGSLTHLRADLFI